MYSIVTTDNIREWLKISDEGEETTAFLNRLALAVTHTVNKHLMRKLLNDDYTEIYDGPPGKELVLNQYPVFDNGSNFTLYEDAERTFAAASIVAATDYRINTSSGIVTLYNRDFNAGSGTVKVVYNAGVTTISCNTGVNDTFVIERSGTDHTITLAAGDYTTAQLVTQIQSKIDAASIAGDAITVSYNPKLMQFLFSSDSSFKVEFGLWNAANELLGFDSDIELTANQNGTVYEVCSSKQVVFTPEDIVTACNMIIQHWFQSSNRGSNTLGVKSQRVQGDTVTEYVKKGIPEDAKQILSCYKREIPV